MSSTPHPHRPSRPTSGRSLLGGAVRDLRHAARTLAPTRSGSRGFTVTALLTLTLCIAAAAAVFGVFRSVVLEPLPFEASEDLVNVTNSYPGAGVERASNGVPDYFDRKEQVEAFAEVAVHRERGMTLLRGERPRRISVGIATPGLFPLLRLDAHRGRLFTPEEGEPGNDAKALLSHGMWRRLGGADDGGDPLLGDTLLLDGEPYQVVGVLPPGFTLPGYEDTEVWIPAAFTPEQRSDERRHSNSWGMLARLAPGASLQQARIQVDALNERNMERFPQLAPLLEDAGFRTLVANYRQDLVREVEPKLTLLVGGALFVLLIGCVNIANLVLVRTTTRKREIATRSALGAGRWQVTRQLVLENLVLSMAGGVLGLAAGWGALELLPAVGSADIPRGAEIGMDWTVALATLGAAALIGVVLGTIPVVQVLRSDLSAIFREEGRTGSSSRGAVVARNALVVVQVAFAFVLLVGAGFLLASFVRTVAVDPGFEPEGVLTADVGLPETRYPEPEDRRAFFARLLERAEALPGVEAAGMTDSIPFGSSYSSSVITVEGYTPQPGESVRSPYRRVVTRGFFEAMGIEVLAGRTFDRRDTAESQRVAVVDRWLAEKYWPGRDPVGGRLYMGVPELIDEENRPEWRTVIGVVEEIRAADLAGDPTQGAYYFVHAQEPEEGMTLALRTDTPDAAAAALRSELRALDPELPLDDVMPMTKRVEESLGDARLPMLLSAVFAAVALFLAAVGIYGVLAYSVAQRTRELAVRLALGSTAREVFGLVMRQGVVLLLVGFAVGLTGAVALTRVLSGLLYGVGVMDPAVYLPVVAVLALVALVATLLPARRATRVDPAVALAAE